jgi:hypothetical protein
MLFDTEMPLNRADTLQRTIDFFAVAVVVFYRGVRKVLCAKAPSCKTFGGGRST